MRVDAAYELQVAFKVTPASNAEQPAAHELIDELDETHPEITEDCNFLFFFKKKTVQSKKLI